MYKIDWWYKVSEEIGDKLDISRNTNAARTWEVKMATANKVKIDQEYENYLKLRAKLAQGEGASFSPKTTTEGRRQWATIETRLVKQWGFSVSGPEASEAE